MAVIALSYMILNFARFGNITEFGHNYLPEFTRSELGQFNIGYMAENLNLAIPLCQRNVHILGESDIRILLGIYCTFDYKARKI